MSPYYPLPEFKCILATERSFDHQGKPCPIMDDDLDDIFSKSDYTRGKKRDHA